MVSKQKILMELDSVKLNINPKDITDKYKKPIIPISSNSLKKEFIFTCKTCNIKMTTEQENEMFCSLCKTFLMNIEVIYELNSIIEAYTLAQASGLKNFTPIKEIDNYLNAMNKLSKL